MSIQTRATPKKAPSKAVNPNRNSVQTAYLWIKKQIISGQFKAGEILPQATLAKQCKISRGPIREALRLLQNQGLIEAESNQRARVASFSPEDLAQISASMIVNVGAAIVASASAWEETDLLHIRTLVEKLKSSSETVAGAEMDIDELNTHRRNIHRALVMALCAHAGSPTQQILDNHFDRITIFRQMMKSSGGMTPDFPLSSDFIDAMNDAISNRDTRAMALAITHRIANIGQTALEEMKALRWSSIIDNALAFSRAALGAESATTRLRQITTYSNQKISITQEKSGGILWLVED